MRGAVSVAMVYYRFDPKNNTADSHSATIVVTTLQVVLYSTVGMGGVTGPLLQYLLPQQVLPRSFRFFPRISAQFWGCFAFCLANLRVGTSDRKV